MHCVSHLSTATGLIFSPPFPDVVEAAKKGRFRIYAVKDIDKASKS
jgi:hypothetical protein